MPCPNCGNTLVTLPEYIRCSGCRRIAPQEQPKNSFQEPLTDTPVQTPKKEVKPVSKQMDSFDEYNKILCFNGNDYTDYEAAKKWKAVYATGNTIDDATVDGCRGSVGFDISEIISMVTKCIGGEPNIIYGILNKQGEFIKLPLTFEE